MTPGVLQTVQFTFRCELASGLHARPASHLSEEANRFQSNFTLTNLRNHGAADLKSVLSIVAADVRCGDDCSVSIEGVDADAAADSLRHFLAERLPAFEEPPARSAPAQSHSLPRGLDALQPCALYGHAVSAGIGAGKIIHLDGLSLLDSSSPGAGPTVERPRLAAALDKVRSRVQSRIDAAPNTPAAAILTAHLAILSDHALEHELEHSIDAGQSAAAAIAAAGRHFAQILGGSESALVRERALDIQELCIEVIDELEGRHSGRRAAVLSEPSIVVADALAPHQLLSLDRSLLQGLVLESAGATSHAVILARSLGIPAVSGVPGAVSALASAKSAVIDGSRGIVFPDPGEPVADFYRRERAAQATRNSILEALAAAPAITADGFRLEIAANIASPDEVEPALRRGADSIGLIRTEILFAAARKLPTEDEQFEQYARAAKTADGRSFVIRTLDAGADKPIPALPLPAESNPFLGYRGIRIYPEYRDWFASQLRAAYRASAFGAVWIMAPMITNVDEGRWFGEQCRSARSELAARRVAFNAETPIGAMIEVPRRSS